MRANRSGIHPEALHLQLHPEAERKVSWKIMTTFVAGKPYLILIHNPSFQFLIVSLKTIPLLCDLVNG